MAGWTNAKREAYYRKHPENFADSEMRYPIADAADVHDAVRLYGKADDPQAVKRRIIAIARRLNLAHALPPSWQTGTQEQRNEEEHLLISPRILETLDLAPGAGEQAPGHDIRVTVIQGGTSINGYHYDEAALRSIADLVEGAHAFADHGADATRSVRDMIGFYHDAAYIPPSSRERNGRVDATLHIMESADWLWSLISEALELQRPDLIGLSIDIFGQWQQSADQTVKEVTSVASLNSCDVVTRPSAGGSFRRILHHSEQKDSVYEGAESMFASENEAWSMDPEGSDITAGPAPLGHATAPTGTAALQESSRLADNDGQRAGTIHSRHTEQLDRLMHDLQLERCRLTLQRRLQESILPRPVREQIHKRFNDSIFEEAELEREITSSLGMMAQLQQQGLVRGHGYARPEIGEQITEAEKAQAAFDAMFDIDIDRARLGNIRGFGSIREAYARVTGDGSLAAGISANSQLGNIRVHEAAPITRLTEADITTASFSYLLGTSMNKRLLKDYQTWPAEWQKFCTIVPIRDFKQQSRVRLGAFGSLPVVAEDGVYTAATLTDSAAVYVPQKRGNLVIISRETIINDDLQAIKQIPTKLAVSAAYTLAEFVYAFLTGNPTIYDGSALFTASAPHSNLAANALNTGSLQTAVTAMREQSNYAGKRLGLRPRFLVVPPELEFTAMIITQSAAVPGSNNNDINPMLGYVTPIVSPQISSATQWFLAGDPREIDTIEIGFVGGQINPALFVQDSPLLGLNFSQDAITYKIRHEYGGAVVDYRGLYRGQ